MSNHSFAQKYASLQADVPSGFRFCFFVFKCLDLVCLTSAIAWTCVCRPPSGPHDAAAQAWPSEGRDFVSSGQVHGLKPRDSSTRFSRSATFLTPFFGWEGSPAKIDHGEKDTLHLTSLLEDIIKCMPIPVR